MFFINQVFHKSGILKKAVSERWSMDDKFATLARISYDSLEKACKTKRYS